MNDVARCPSCQTELPPDARAGVCPKCLIAAGFRSEPPPTVASPGAGSFVPPSPTELARNFPQFDVLELIGRGGMGAIYKARQPALDRIVALKILPREVGSDPEFADRFMREWKALARLNHPNIVTIYESGHTAGLYYFVMEYVDGVNLRQTMRDGGVSAAQALAIIPQICDALQYAHEQGIIHRDIKPENILLDRKGRVKIADFGLSKLLGHDAPEPVLTQTHQVMGTLRYMAPEQMQGTKSVDHRADIYSLGVVFYELLTGEVPMGRFEPPSQRVQVDVRLDEVVLRSLEREPTKRYQHASEVKTDVEAISKGTFQAAPPLPAAPLSSASVPLAADGVVFKRLTVFNVLFWLVWSALLAALQWGYLSDANWYFKKELPYNYLTWAWTWVSLIFAWFFGYWWYLLVKSPETPRSWQDAYRLMQTPDRRHLSLWLPLGAFLLLWIAATVVTMNFYDDDVQSTILTALFIAAPVVAMASCFWTYRNRAQALRRERIALQPAAQKGLSSGCFVALVLGIVFLVVAVPVVLAIGAMGFYWLTPQFSPEKNQALITEAVPYVSDRPMQKNKPRETNPVKGADRKTTTPASSRPSAERVARRAHALALVNYRASLEPLAGQEKYEALQAKLPQWIEALDLAAEFEQRELDLLQAPLGKAEEQLTADATWRDEGLAVLAWALGRFELSPYDQSVKPPLAESIGFSEERLAALDTSIAEKLFKDAQLRPADAIDRYAVHATLIHWRLRSSSLSAEADSEQARGMNFAGYLREHPSFKESWLNGLRLKDKDLTIGGVALGEAQPKDVERCEAIAVERQIAACWLRGDAAIYSQVDPATILSDLGESVEDATLNPLNVRLERIGHLADGGDDPFLSLAVQGKYAYMIQGNVEKPKRLQVVDLSEPSQPKIVGSHPVTVEAMRLAVMGDHVYVLDDPLLRVFDVSKPSEPRAVGSCELGEHLWDLAVQGAFAYVTDVGSVRVIDLKDPTMPRQVGRCEVPDAQGITISGDYAYIACDIEGMHVVDIAKPETPKEVGVFSEPAGAADVTIAGQHAFIVGGEDAVTLWIADISDRARPTRVCKYGDWIAGSVAVDGKLAYLAGGDLDILDISDLANLAAPKKVGSYNDVGFVTALGNHVYVIGDEGFSILRVVDGE